MKLVTRCVALVLLTLLPSMAWSDTPLVSPAGGVRLSDYVCRGGESLRLDSPANSLARWCYQELAETLESSRAVLLAECVHLVARDARTELLLARAEIAAGALERAAARLRPLSSSDCPAADLPFGAELTEARRVLAATGWRDEARVELRVSQPEQAVIELDGRALTPSPVGAVSIDLQPGTHTLRIRRASVGEWTASVTVGPGDTVSLNELLEPGLVEAPRRLEAWAREDAERMRRGRFVATWFGVTAAVLTGAGVTLSVRASSLSNEAARYDLSSGGASLERREEIDRSSVRYATAANATFAAGAFCGGAALLSWWYSRELSPAVQVSPLPGGASVRWDW